MIVLEEIEYRGPDIRAEDLACGTLALTADPDQSVRAHGAPSDRRAKVGDQRGHRITLLENTGDFRDTTSTDTVKNLHNFANPFFAESVRKRFVDCALATGRQGSGLFC